MHNPQRSAGWWSRTGRARDDERSRPDPGPGVGDDDRVGDTPAPGKTGTAEDVRDDEATRAADPGPAAPGRSPAGDRADPGAGPGSGAGSRADTGGDTRTATGTGPGTDAGAPDTADLLDRLAAAERARDEAEAALHALRRRADALAEALDDARARPPETFGMRAEKVLRMAEHDAALRRRAAEAEAAELVEQAGADAGRITAEAWAEADRITTGAWDDVDRLRAAGAAARRDSELVADTAASMHAHVSELRGTVHAEIARLHALLGSELDRLEAPRPGESAVREPDGQPDLRPDLRPDTPPAVSLPAQRGSGGRPATGRAGGDPDGDGAAVTGRAGVGEPASGGRGGTDG